MKKHLFFIATILCSLESYCQVLNYSDIGLLLSQSSTNGTARFNSMAGAFGAVGGDLSSMRINPAAGAVFKLSEFGFSLAFNDLTTTSNYYGSSNRSNSNTTDFAQIGFVNITDLSRYSDEWTKVFFGFNYVKTANYNNSWFADGNSGVTTWVEDPTDPDILYTNAEYQNFDSFSKGGRHSYSFYGGAQWGKDIYFGIGVITQTMDYYQNTIQEEFNNDGNGNTVDGYLEEWEQVRGNAISFNFGIIAKVSRALRIGLSYETASKWSMSEESNLVKETPDDLLGYYELQYSTDPGFIYSNNYDKVLFYDYSLDTPGKLTASAALVVGKLGLFSFDYTSNFYNQLQFPNALEFQSENGFFVSEIQNTMDLAAGAEIRAGILRIRGGYKVKESPFKNDNQSSNQEEYSLGIGFDKGRFKLDIAYQYYTSNGTYDFYPDYREVQPAILTQDLSKITTSLLIRL